MLIRVIRLNGKYDMVKPQVLNHLIDLMLISQFERSSGWVNIRQGPMRMVEREDYGGEERRNLH